MRPAHRRVIPPAAQSIQPALGLSIARVTAAALLPWPALLARAGLLTLATLAGLAGSLLAPRCHRVALAGLRRLITPRKPARLLGLA